MYPLTDKIICLSSCSEAFEGSCFDKFDTEYSMFSLCKTFSNKSHSSRKRPSFEAISTLLFRYSLEKG